MPSLPDVPNVLRMTFEGQQNGVPAVNVMHAAFVGGIPTPADLELFGSSLEAFWVGNFLPLQNPDYGLRSIKIVDLSSMSAAQADHVAVHPGTHGGDACMAQVAIVLSWKISRRYRGGKPRTYMAGIAENQVIDPQHISVGYTAAWAAAAETFRTNVNAYGTAPFTAMTLGSVSYYTGHAVRPAPLFDPFTSVAVDSRIDTQRRRLGR